MYAHGIDLVHGTALIPNGITCRANSAQRLTEIEDGVFVSAAAPPPDLRQFVRGRRLSCIALMVGSGAAGITAPNYFALKQQVCFNEATISDKAADPRRRPFTSAQWSLHRRGHAVPLATSRSSLSCPAA